MVQYATVFLIVALVAAIFGIGAIAVGATEFAAILFLLFVVLFVGGIVSALRNSGNAWAQERSDK
jgi:uncharacterized membrane protein YtjA (UPF0391 family)